MQYKNMTASARLATGNGEVYGYVVNSNASAGTIRVLDSLTDGAGRIILNTTTLPTTAADIPTVVKLPEAASFVTGLYITIGGTCNITVIYKYDQA